MLRFKWQDKDGGVGERIMEDIAATEYMKWLIEKGGVILEWKKVEAK